MKNIGLKQPLILIAEDNNANLLLAVSILKRQNYDLAVATNGEEALNIIKEKIPDLILLDIMMPGIDGYEVCNKLKDNEKTKDIPIIFLTALRKTESLIQGFNCGAVDYITKPFNKEELVLRVKNHLDLKFAKDKILMQNTELERLNNEINTLLKITAHDLKNPIQGISGLLEIIQIMIKSGNTDKEELLDIVNSSIGSAELANSIIMDILDLNRISKGEINFKQEEIDLQELAETLYANNKYKAEKKNIDFHFTNFENSLVIKTDQDKLYRILDNLISNANKFTKPGKSIRFECNINSSEITFDIIDEGLGISEQDQKNLFKRFVILSNKPTGDETSSGLGLSIVKEFADLLNYEISFNSKEGEGSKFSVIIKK